jgi:hypothetical protein
MGDDDDGPVVSFAVDDEHPDLGPGFPVPGHADHARRREESLARSAANIESYRRRVQEPRGSSPAPQPPTAADEEGGETPGTQEALDDDVVTLPEHPRELAEALQDLTNGNAEAAIQGIMGLPFSDAHKEDLLDQLVLDAPATMRPELLRRIQQHHVERHGYPRPENLYERVLQRILGAPQTEEERRNYLRNRKAAKKLGEELARIEKERTAGPLKDEEIRKVLERAERTMSRWSGPKEIGAKVLMAALIGGLASVRVGVKGGAATGGGIGLILTALEEIFGGQQLSYRNELNTPFRQLYDGALPADQPLWTDPLGSGHSVFQILDKLGLIPKLLGADFGPLGFAIGPAGMSIPRRGTTEHLLIEPRKPYRRPHDSYARGPPLFEEEDPLFARGAEERIPAGLMLRRLAKMRTERPKANDSIPEPQAPPIRSRGRPIGSKDKVKRKRKKRAEEEEEEEEEKKKKKRVRGGLASEFVKSVDKLEGKKRLRKGSFLS